MHSWDLTQVSRGNLWPWSRPHWLCDTAGASGARHRSVTYYLMASTMAVRSCRRKRSRGMCHEGGGDCWATPAHSSLACYLHCNHLAFISCSSLSVCSQRSSFSGFLVSRYIQLQTSNALGTLHLLATSPPVRSSVSDVSSSSWTILLTGMVC